ncbi:hypothetical protein FBU30_004076 [Linnemannia zychae]|nr:hypothetical protein FBU30_004076 [Linnemannia zychae]
MRDADSLILVKYRNYLLEVVHQCAILTEAENINLKMNDLSSKIAAIESEISRYDSDHHCIIYESNFKEDWKLFHIISTTSLEYSHDSWIIDGIWISSNMCNLLEQKGGKGYTFWNATFKRESFENGSFHVILSTESRRKHQPKILELKHELYALNMSLASEKLNLQRCRRSMDECLVSAKDVDKHTDLITRRNNISKLICQVSSKTLPLDVFLDIASKHIYRGLLDECAPAVEQYWANKMEIPIQSS